MRPDDLLRKLGTITRDDDESVLGDERLEKLLRGELSGREIRALAAEDVGNPGLATAAALFMPLSPEAEARILARVSPRSARPPAWRRFARAVAMTGLVIACALFAASRVPLSPMPLYSFEIQGASGRDLGQLAGEEPIDLRRNMPLRMTLRPATTTEGEVGARAFLMRGKDIRSWSPPFVVSQEGTVTLDGRSASLFDGVPEGAWEMLFIVGHAAALPNDSEGVAELLAEPEEATSPLRRLSRSVVLTYSQPIPMYHAEITSDGSTVQVASSMARTIDLYRYMPFQVSLRPAVTTDRDIDVLAFLVQGTEVQSWSPPLAVLDDGTVRLEGRAERDFQGIRDGAWEMVLIVGRASALPRYRDELPDLMAEPQDATGPVRVLRVSIVLHASRSEGVRRMLTRPAPSAPTRAFSFSESMNMMELDPSR